MASAGLADPILGTPDDPVIKTFVCNTQVNAAAISPLKPHVRSARLTLCGDCNASNPARAPSHTAHTVHTQRAALAPCTLRTTWTPRTLGPRTHRTRRTPDTFS